MAIEKAALGGGECAIISYDAKNFPKGLEILEAEADGESPAAQTRFITLEKPQALESYARICELGLLAGKSQKDADEIREKFDTGSIDVKARRRSRFTAPSISATTQKCENTARSLQPQK